MASPRTASSRQTACLHHPVSAYPRTACDLQTLCDRLACGLRMSFVRRTASSLQKQDAHLPPPPDDLRHLRASPMVFLCAVRDHQTACEHRMVSCLRSFCVG